MDKKEKTKVKKCKAFKNLKLCKDCDCMNKCIFYKLENMYIECFDECKNSDQCINNNVSKYETCFRYNHAAEISKGYIKEKYKILVVGSESYGARNHIVKTHQYSVYNGINMHWWWTMLTIIKFCTDIKNNELIDISSDKVNGPLVNEIFNRCNFAFTDYYKCAFGSGGKGWKDCKNNDLTDNCYYIFENEVKILKPNLIVFQKPDLLSYIIKKSRDKNKCKNKQKYWKTKNKKVYMTKVKIGKREIFAISSYFPTTRHKKWNATKVFLFNLIDKYKKIAGVKSYKRIWFNGIDK